MKDGIISETKNSRIIKADLPETYEELKQLAAGNGVPIDMLFNALGWSQTPTFLTKGTLLSDVTEEAIWSNAQNRTVDEALKMLADVAYGRVATLNLTVQDTAGNPIPDVAVRLDRAADIINGPFTDLNGEITIDTSGGSHTVNLAYPLGYSASTGTKQVQVTGTTSETIKEVSRVSTDTVFKYTTSTNNLRVARFLSPIKVHLMGGGGSGAACIDTSSSTLSNLEAHAQGGTSGESKIISAIDVAGKLISFTIGAGGSSVVARTSGRAVESTNGNNGGSTTFKVDSTTHTAGGGYGGKASPSSMMGKNTGSYRASGGGAYWENYDYSGCDGDKGGYLFADSSQQRVGGGGGGAISEYNYDYGGNGGETGGGDGKQTREGSSWGTPIADNGTGNCGAGGGGVASVSTYEGLTATSGKGDSGLVAFRKA